MTLISRVGTVATGILLGLVLACPPVLADIKLPAPTTTGGLGVFDALKQRSSSAGGDLGKAISQEDLSTILWAASGLNRGVKGWTVPMAMGSAPYCQVYAASADGVFMYNWADHALKEISRSDIRGEIGAQPFVKNAGGIFIIVADSQALSSYDQTTADEFSNVLAGAMTQNIYLAATGLDIGARYIRSMKIEPIKKELQLGENDRPVCLMLLGKK